MERFGELKNILVKASDSTSMFYHNPSYGEKKTDEYWPSMKLYTKSGILFFTDKTRHFNIIKYQIPSWNSSRDLSIIKKICNGENFIWCEADHADDEYVYTISLIHEFIVNHD